jgi:hypothetical protein
VIEVVLVGLGGDAVDDASDRERGGAQEGGVGGADQGTRHLQEFILAGLGDGRGQFLGLGFLLGREGLLPPSFSESGGGFLGESPFSPLVYKDSTNLRDAHTA